MNKRFWEGKQVLITGYEGFLGSNLTRRMIALGANVVGIDIDVRRRNSLLSKEDYKKIKVIEGSIVDYSLMDRIIARHKPEYIFHLAAEAIVGKCNNDPVCTFKTNIEGTWNILEIARKKPGTIKGIVVASSDKAYGSHAVLPYKEETSLKGDHPYDASKSCADLLCYTYFNTYKVPVVVTRCGNIYGPGDFNYSRIIPDAIRCVLSGTSLKIRSDGKFTRDYVYVDDIVKGYIMIAEQLIRKKLSGNAFNFSYENPLMVLQLVKKIGGLMTVKPDIVILNEAKYEIKHQYLSSVKARKLLGWKPELTIEKGLQKTIEWYRRMLLEKKFVSL